MLLASQVLLHFLPASSVPPPRSPPALLLPSQTTFTFLSAPGRDLLPHCPAPPPLSMVSKEPFTPWPFLYSSEVSSTQPQPASAMAIRQLPFSPKVGLPITLISRVSLQLSSLFPLGSDSNHFLIPPGPMITNPVFFSLPHLLWLHHTLLKPHSSPTHHLPLTSKCAWSKTENYTN